MAPEKLLLNRPFVVSLCRHARFQLMVAYLPHVNASSRAPKYSLRRRVLDVGKVKTRESSMNKADQN